MAGTVGSLVDVATVVSVLGLGAAAVSAVAVVKSRVWRDRLAAPDDVTRSTVPPGRLVLARRAVLEISNAELTGRQLVLEVGLVVGILAGVVAVVATLL